MTTLVDNIMTLSNARYSNDDQQVPDTNGVVVPGQKKSPKPRLPDFSSLLLEPQNNTVLNTPDLIQSLDFGYQDQVDTATGSFMEANPWGEEEESIYDGITPQDTLEKPQKAATTVKMPTAAAAAAASLASLEPVRPNTLSLAPSQVLPPGLLAPSATSSTMLTMMGVDDATMTTTATLQYAVSPASSTCSPVVPNEPFENAVEQYRVERMEEELDAICRSHWIPRDPTSWNTEHVQKWVKLVRDRYNLPEEDQFLLGIDGTTLCMFSERDFIQRTSSSVGSYFHADLVWWKAACGSPMECNPPMTYTDLSASTPNNTLVPSTVSSSNPNMYSTVTLSSPVMTKSSPVMTQSSDIPTPVLADLELTKSTLYQINNEVEQQQHQQQQQQQGFSYLSSLWDEGSNINNSSSNNNGGGSCDSSLNSVEFNNALSAHVKQEVMEADDDESEDEDVATMCGEKRRYVSHSKHTIHLWQFLKNLLQSPEHYGNYIKWLDHTKGIFKIENSREVAKLWGQRKNRPAMNYDKLSRSIRQYYKKGIIKKTTHSKRLVYQFQPTYL